MKGNACCDAVMLDGEKLVAALTSAMEAKRAINPGFGPSALGRALGISQPSASELLKTGRLKKERYMLLVDAFADVVGPEHWGLPYSASDFEALRLYQQLPLEAQRQLRDRMSEFIAEMKASASALVDGLQVDVARPPVDPAAARFIERAKKAPGPVSSPTATQPFFKPKGLPPDPQPSTKHPRQTTTRRASEPKPSAK